MKLLIDMNLSPLWVEFFAASGFESIHWSKVGEPTAPDCVIMDYAAVNGFVIFTHDLDFGALLADQKSRQPSVIQIRTQDVSPGGDRPDRGARPEGKPATTGGRSLGHGRSRPEQDPFVANLVLAARQRQELPTQRRDRFGNGLETEIMVKQTFVHGNIQRGAKTKLSKSSVTMRPVLAQLLKDWREQKPRYPAD